MFNHHQIIITMKEPIITKSVFAGTRCYHLDAREDVKGDPYLQIVECPTNGKGKRQRIFVHAQDLDKFRDAVNYMVNRCKELNVSKR